MYNQIKEEDEMTLTIRMKGTKTQIFVGDMQIGLVESLSYKVSNGSVLPVVELKLADVPSMQGASENMLKSHQRYKEALDKLPSFVQRT
jgi:hypothetical protein